jgi:short-subunit dehydrogenase
MARQLADRAKSIVLVARRGQRLEELRDELAVRAPQLKIHLHATDLADAAQVQRLFEWLKQEKIEVDFLINNAGLGDLGSFATSDPDKIDHIVLVNIRALTTFTHRLLPEMIRKGRGAILNVSSSAGFLPIAEFSVYAASKAYVTSFSEGLRAELRGTGVNVCTLCPGPIHTEFTEVARRPNNPIPPGPEFAHVSVEAVARVGLDAIERDRPLVIPGLVMKIAMTLVRLTPLAILRMASRFARKRA